ncbi:MAG: tetratricopeptide repeat protein [Gammaproteobacteria bacterium]|nr:tetratricopeptide repeat protein [Gammaproteobacteria bacterium]MDE0442086.1 tetratricopeptide repeat protein [Gammaproteobacteria bacterium]
MSDPAVKEALDLMDRAWRTRYRAFQQRPDSEEDLQRVIASVHADLEKAVAICRDVGAKRELSMALGKLGHVVEDAEAKLGCYVEAVAAARECGDAMQIAHSVRHLGDVHRNAGRRAEAKGCYNEALNLYRSEASAPPLDVANAVRPMAILKADLGERKEALGLWREARELYATVGIEEGVEEADRWIERLT